MALVLARLALDLVEVVEVVVVEVEAAGPLMLAAHLHEEAVLDGWGW